MKCDSPYWVLPKAAFEKVPVPCGRCPPCKHRRVNSWVFRLVQEERVSLSSHFITLTYDSRFVPFSEKGWLTLRKKDVQDYWKRLRKLCSDSTIKYYVVGEYGSKNQRPHYHAIVFNVPDTKFFFDAWSLDGVPLGAVHIGQCTSDSIAYCMKYIDKDSSPLRFGGRILPKSADDRVPQFSLMSKGLGSNYLTPDVVAYHKADISRLYLTKPGGHRIALPRYYRQRIYSDSDLKAQVLLIGNSMLQQDLDDRVEFRRLYPASSGYTYEAYVSSRRYGRHISFYKNQTSRDV